MGRIKQGGRGKRQLIGARRALRGQEDHHVGQSPRTVARSQLLLGRVLWLVVWGLVRATTAGVLCPGEWEAAVAGRATPVSAAALRVGPGWSRAERLHIPVGAQASCMGDAGNRKEDCRQPDTNDQGCAWRRMLHHLLILFALRCPRKSAWVERADSQIGERGLAEIFPGRLPFRLPACVGSPFHEPFRLVQVPLPQRIMGILPGIDPGRRQIPPG